MAITIEDLKIKKRDNHPDKFDAAELKGRHIFQGWCFAKPFCKVNKWSKDKFSHWDVSYTNKTDLINIIGEIKVRDLNHNDFDTAYLEMSKYNELRAIKGTSNAKIHYICIYNDKMLRFDITHLDLSQYKIITQELPITTADGNSETREKEIILLPITTKIND